MKTNPPILILKHVPAGRDHPAAWSWQWRQGRKILCGAYASTKQSAEADARICRPEQPPPVREFDFDNTQAFAEGWALFDDGDLQRLDEAEVFSSDREAARFVLDQAMAGSRYHQQALHIHARQMLVAGSLQIPLASK